MARMRVITLARIWGVPVEEILSSASRLGLRGISSEASLAGEDEFNRILEDLTSSNHLGMIRLATARISKPETTIPARSKNDSHRVFIVHGHDDAPREAVARFIERAGLETVILHERPNKGRTIISKLRSEADDVGFAVVLMTPDDHGGKANEPTTKPRARQNVVFELGFFIGLLGPERVSALVKDDVERPGDYDGVVYLEFDLPGAWKQKLGRELESAGLPVDWKAAMKF